MAKIYVSSTRNDLRDYREKVSQVIRRMGHEDVAMEYYVAEHRPPVAKCLDDVAACDLYVGLFAWRYGWVPEDDNPEGLAITEMEYRQAVKSGKECLIFLLSDEAPWPPKFIDADRSRIEMLRAELASKHSSGPPFKSADELGRFVAEALNKWEKEHGLAARGLSIPELELTAYYAALTRRYQHLNLDALTPPQRDENLRQRLREVFVEQNVRENPPPVELPKEVWEKLQRDREIHTDDLPSGVTPEDVLRARESYFEKPSRPVLEVLADPRRRHVIVLGDPGSGKSTLTRYTLLSLISDAGDERLRRAFEGHLPLLIELRSFVGFYAHDKRITFLEFLEALGENEGWQLNTAALKHFLDTDGRAVVIFDGLDEIFDPEDRERIVRSIAGFAAKHPKARVLVTSRVIGYRRKILTDAGFDHFTLQDLDERQVAAFIDRWYALVLDERPEDARARRERIMRSFKESASIRQLAGNPMLLTIMAIIGKNQELPRERWKLYDHAAAVLIHHWDIERHLENKNIKAPFIGEEEKKELLRRLAYKMQGSMGGLSGNHIHRDDLQAEFEAYLRVRFNQPPADATTIARAMIEQFRSRNFILSLYGANLYGFVHRAFLEFFCATALAQKFEKARELTLEELKRNIYGAHWEDRTWHEVLRLICGMIDEKFAGEIIDYLAQSLYQPWPKEFGARQPWNIALAVQCLGEIRNLAAIESVAEGVLRFCLQLFERAIIHFERDLTWFLDNDLAPSAKSIGSAWPGRELIIDWLEQTLRPDRSRTFHNYPNTHACGIFVGSVCSDRVDLRELLTVSVHHRSEGVQCFVAHALLEYRRGQRESFELLKYSVSHMSYATARTLAATYLAELWSSEPEVLLLLLDLYDSDSDEHVRGAVLQALGKHFTQDSRVLDLLLHRVVNESQWVRRSALDTLAEHFRDNPVIPPLLRERAMNDPSVWVRRRAEKLARELRY